MSGLPLSDKARAKIRASAESAAKSASIDDLTRWIEEISSTLKGSGFSFGERLAMNEERHAFRNELAARTTPQAISK